MIDLNKFVKNRFETLSKRSRLFTSQKSSVEYLWLPSGSYHPENSTMVLFLDEKQEIPKNPTRHDNWNLLFFKDSKTRHPMGAFFFGDEGIPHVWDSIYQFVNELIAARLINKMNLHFCGNGLGGNASLKFGALLPNSRCVLVNPVLLHNHDSFSAEESQKWLATIFGETSFSSFFSTELLHPDYSERTTLIYDVDESSSLYSSNLASIANNIADSRKVDAYSDSYLLSLFSPKEPESEDVKALTYRFPATPQSVQAKIRIELISRPPIILESEFQFGLDPFNDRSWRFWLQNFSWVPNHINSIPVENQKEQAHFIVQKWFEHLESKDIDTEFFYHDHSLAYRGENLLKLLPFLDEEWAEPVKQHIRDIGYLLSSPLEDNALSNHAFDQAVSLFLIANHFSDEDLSSYWMELSQRRLERELKYSFTGDGVHVENSPSYHHGMITNIHGSLGKILSVTPNPTIQEYYESLSKTVPFLSWIIRPDGKVPPIGDSEEKLVSTQLAKSLNPEGFPKTFDGMKVFGNGYGIWKSNQENYHMTLKSCLHGRFHRHDDDCSITLWANGKNLIVDSGLLYYQEKDVDRIHVRSATGHSGFELPGKQANRNFFSSTAFRSKVIKVEENGAKAIMGMYGNITASRTASVDSRVVKLNDRFSKSCLSLGIKVHFIVDGIWRPEANGNILIFSDDEGAEWSLKVDGCSPTIEMTETFTSPLKNQKRKALRVTFLPVSEEAEFSIDFGGV